MELTLRQKAFFDVLVDLYREAQRPVHYSVLGQRLGVSRFSAYDMLKLLEAKGLVRAEYVLDEREGGPGRSSVVFAPLLKAQELLCRLVTNPVEQGEWSQTVAHILGHLRQEQNPPDARDSSLLEELLAAIPKAMSPLAYSAQTLTALLLPVRNRLESLDRDLATILNLDEEGAESGGGLELLAGFALGASLSDTTSRLGRDISSRLAHYSRTCQNHIARMDAERRQVLGQFVREVLANLGPNEHLANS
jgi:DNA-binding PadR family transcriptional regulator